jgi:subtilisin family serine protease
MPWAQPSRMYSLPDSLLLKLSLGEAPEAIPAARDVRRGAQSAVAVVDGGPIDRIIRHFSAGAQVTRVHGAAATLHEVGQGHQGFSALEHALGLSRTLRIEVEHAAPVADLVDALRQIATVEHASPHYLCTLPFATGAAPAAIDAERAWMPRLQVCAGEALAYEPGDRAVIVAVVDTGVLLEHPELRPHLRRGRDMVRLEPHDLPAGIRLLADDAVALTDLHDLVGHGTACAGIIGATGEEIPPGLAGDCGLLPVKVLGSVLFPGKTEPIGVGAIADIDEGCKTAIDLGAKVLNMSFGTPAAALDPHDPLPHTDIVQYGLARGCIMVAASGNSGRVEQMSPAALDGVIAVGAIGSDGRPTAFSTSGDHVALCAPGERIVTAGLQGYAAVTGTSFAAPFVTAAVALLVSRAEGRAFALEGRAARRILCDSAHPWPRGESFAGHGAGVLDAYAALQALDQEIDQQAIRDLSSRQGRSHSGGGSTNGTR